ncbi:hypothetical protein [Paraburkholderia bonniea]|uniref:hypothetical protein n=1 Tax=Paraburkholderia bonniea TaxID=2152891 RepID=UPI0012916F41|nr:hypothetical protein [Paraburkholderia bonniea]
MLRILPQCDIFLTIVFPHVFQTQIEHEAKNERTQGANGLKRLMHKASEVVSAAANGLRQLSDFCRFASALSLTECLM